MKRIVAPMVGGLVTSFIMELLVYPPIYFLWRKRQLSKSAVELELVQAPSTS
jgi:Cu(I)/Ag(I) efflux system membrane protein CusA/SilA